MARFGLILVITSVTLILFHLGGILTDTPISWLITFLIQPQNYGDLELYKLIIAAVAVTSTAGVIVGSIVQQRAEMVVLAAVATASFFILGDLIAIGLKLSEIHIALGLLIASPMVLIYLVTVVDWWLGRTAS